MRRALLAAVASLAAGAVAPAAAGAVTISLGSGLGITYSDGPALSVTVAPPSEVELLLADGETSNCAAANPFASPGTPSCNTSGDVLPSTSAQLATGQAQLTDVSLFVNAQGADGASATDEVVIINPYTGVAYDVVDLSCSELSSCDSGEEMILYNSGSEPAPILSTAAWGDYGTLLAQIRAGTTFNGAGTLSGGFGPDGVSTP
jgi:hypothetical protein